MATSEIRLAASHKVKHSPALRPRNSTSTYRRTSDIAGPVPHHHNKAHISVEQVIQIFGFLAQVRQCTQWSVDLSLASTMFGQNRPRDTPLLQLLTTLQPFFQ